jgi:hypothetical protein
MKRMRKWLAVPLALVFVTALALYISYYFSPKGRFDRIKKGMTVPEVEAIMGFGTLDLVPLRGLNDARIVGFYMVSLEFYEAEASVYFDLDGIVIGKAWDERGRETLIQRLSAWLKF